jgi:hypothetical protein
VAKETQRWKSQEEVKGKGRDTANANAEWEREWGGEVMQGVRLDGKSRTGRGTRLVGINLSRGARWVAEMGAEVYCFDIRQPFISHTNNNEG